MSTAADDLAYVRDLAEAGQSAPLLGGRFLAWWGGLVTLAYAAHYLIVSGIAGVEAIWLAWLWIGFSVIGMGGYITLMRLFPADKPGQSSAGNRADATVWTAGGFALFAFFAGAVIKSGLDNQASVAFIWSLPVVFAVYGVSLISVGVMGENGVLKAAGAVAFGFVTLSVLMVERAEIWLVASAAAALTVFAPGIILMTREPRAVV